MLLEFPAAQRLHVHLTTLDLPTSVYTWTPGNVDAWTAASTRVLPSRSSSTAGCSGQACSRCAASYLTTTSSFFFCLQSSAPPVVADFHSRLVPSLCSLHIKAFFLPYISTPSARRDSFSERDTGTNDVVTDCDTETILKNKIRQNKGKGK